VALFFNAIITTAKAHNPRLTANNDPRQWMADWSKMHMPSSTGVNRMPDLVLVDDAINCLDEVSWRSPKVIAEYLKESYRPQSRLGKAMDTKAWLVLVDQPW